MSLFDRFRAKPDALLQWLEGYCAGRPHGRRAEFLDGYESAGGARLKVALESAQPSPEYLPFVRPEVYLDPAQTAALPSIDDPDWRSRMEDAQGLRVGGGFVLDPDFDINSALLRAHGSALGGYLERFSRAVYQVRYEPPWLFILVQRQGASEAELRRDIERADVLLSFLERP
jgi:hypothetical protein